MITRSLLTPALLAAALLTTSASAYPRSSLFARQDSATCPKDQEVQCGDSLPGNFCCPTGNKCLSLANNTTALCCPDKFTCSSLRTVTCDMNQQDVALNPLALLKTTALDVPLPKCGNNCCPHGFECNPSFQCVLLEDQTLAPGEAAKDNPDDDKKTDDDKKSDDPAEATEEEESGGLGGMAGGIFGGLVAAVVLGIGGWFYWRWRKKRRLAAEAADDDYDEEPPARGGKHAQYPDEYPPQDEQQWDPPQGPYGGMQRRPTDMTSGYDYDDERSEADMPNELDGRTRSARIDHLFRRDSGATASQHGGGGGGDPFPHPHMHGGPVPDPTPPSYREKGGNGRYDGESDRESYDSDGWNDDEHQGYGSRRNTQRRSGGKGGLRREPSMESINVFADPGTVDLSRVRHNSNFSDGRSEFDPYDRRFTNATTFSNMMDEADLGDVRRGGPYVPPVPAMPDYKGRR